VVSETSFPGKISGLVYYKAGSISELGRLVGPAFLEGPLDSGLVYYKAGSISELGWVSGPSFVTSTSLLLDATKLATFRSWANAGSRFLASACVWYLRGKCDIGNSVGCARGQGRVGKEFFITDKLFQFL